jgi:hypothetical protein
MSNNNKSDNNNSPNKNTLVVPTQTYNIPNNPSLNPPSLSSNLLTLLSNNPNTTSNSNNNNTNINLNNINNSIYPPKNNPLQINSLQNNPLQNNPLQINSQTIEKTSSIIEKKNSEDSNNKNKNIPSEKSNSSQSPSIHHSSSHNSIFSSDSENNEKNNHRSRNNSLSSSSFIMKNGCCKECMRAFSKNGKSCLCQVPKSERKNTLPEKGCNFCGCHGCNPIDVRKDKRLELKKKLKENKHFNYKNQRLLDSDDEDLKVNEKDIDEWNKKKKNFFEDLKNIFKSDINYMGFGVPIRTQGYILGYQPNSRNFSNKKKYYGGRRNEN